MSVQNLKEMRFRDEIWSSSNILKGGKYCYSGKLILTTERNTDVYR